MHKASIALAAGADFTLLGPERTMLRSRIPVIAICAVRTGAGKSQTARWLSRRLRQKGLAVAVIRHPMPYGDIERQAVQRFATVHDLDQAACTIEEREEYEPHIATGGVVFAGVDYASILQKAEQEADVIVWDGGNNDFSFLRPDLHIVLVDPLRPGDEKRYHPDVIVVDDGPTITHGGMPYGAGYVAAIQAGVKEIVDPRASAVGDIAGVFQHYAHIGKVLPAMGYSRKQLAELQATINGSDAEAVISGTPSDLSYLMDLNKPVVQARYELAEVGEPKLSEVIEKFLRDRSIVRDAAIT
jgi:predicted GTPase